MKKDKDIDENVVESITDTCKGVQINIQLTETKYLNAIVEPTDLSAVPPKHVFEPLVESTEFFIVEAFHRSVLQRERNVLLDCELLTIETHSRCTH